MFPINQPIKHTKKPMLDLGFHTHRKLQLKLVSTSLILRNLSLLHIEGTDAKKKNTRSLIQGVHKPLQNVLADWIQKQHTLADIEDTEELKSLLIKAAPEKK